MSNIITVTEKALVHIQKMLTRRGAGVGMRLSVKNSGCSGKQYVVELIDENNIDYANDKIYTFNPIIICIDPVSFVFVAGTEIDYEINKEKLSGKLIFKNPNQKAACGCGESFYVEE